MPTKGVTRQLASGVKAGLFAAAAGTCIAAHALIIDPSLTYYPGISPVPTYYLSFEEAARAAVAEYCEHNPGYECGFGGVTGVGGIARIVAGGVTYSPVIPVAVRYSCPNNFRFEPGTWLENGIRYGQTYNAVCIQVAPPPPPPPKIVVAIDPGHGFKCPEAGMKIGAQGVTNFTTPPVGLLREDNLTMAIASEIANQMPNSYKVILTKRDVDSCPSFLTRGRIANNANAKAFVSIHINAPGYPLLSPTGTSTLYNVNKSGSFNLADEMARTVSSALGVNNRGAKVDDEIAVLKPTVTNMHAVLLEAARLSGRDEELLHAPTAPTRVASGVVSAIRNFIGK